MEYVKIPQDIRVKDKLIGPLSLIQIIVIGAGGGISYVLFASAKKAAGTVPIAMHAVIWLPLIFAVAFAVIRINDISLFRYCLLMLEMMSKPRRRVWQPRKGIDMVSRFSTPKKKKGKKGEDEIEEEKPMNKSEVKLDELSVILDEKVTATTK
ncbi:hypothetical protein HOF56_04925 [Candidatus Peribacteria bacterium]|jgi:hypothetical protein|nr:hypothetical protein [Candidatus Peribacteria bacterium]MBT4021467.1 hypothetical protein [Candidatus Peribacteria bacterium]MBT4240377.1 hypothetical protein [Candidatus Peribacteria bacterium]MBT4473800.1 hypothetical protein [Candidatus Peribacteria bacterium]